MTAAIDKSSKQSSFIVPDGVGSLRLHSTSSPQGFIDVETYFSPALTSTLINEHDLLGITPKQQKEFRGLTLHQEFHDDCNTGTVTIHCQHKVTAAKDRIVTGVLIGGKCYSNPIIVPAQDSSSPHATTLNSLAYTLQHDPSFARSCLTKTVSNIDSALKSHSDLLLLTLRLAPLPLQPGLPTLSLTD